MVPRLGQTTPHSMHVALVLMLVLMVLVKGVYLQGVVVIGVRACAHKKQTRAKQGIWGSVWGLAVSLLERVALCVRCASHAIRGRVHTHFDHVQNETRRRKVERVTYSFSF
jgi:hypothetical protein